MAPSGISLNKPAAVAIVTLVAGGIILYRWGWSGSASHKDLDSSKSDRSDAVGSAASVAVNEQKVLDISKLAALSSVSDKSLEPFPEKEINIKLEVNGKTLTIFARETAPKEAAKLTVLLLHGQSFTSSNWVEIRTLRLLASWGFRAVAVDLPGSGKSSDVSVSEDNTEEFMSALVKYLGTAPVIVSPSMSGAFSIPYLFKDPAHSTERARAFISVAPTSTSAFAKNYGKSQLPTLIMYGEKDEGLGKTSKENLKALPKSQIIAIPKAGHACYMNNPADFHTAIHYFLINLKS